MRLLVRIFLVKTNNVLKPNVNRVKNFPFFGSKGVFHVECHKLADGPE